MIYGEWELFSYPFFHVYTLNEQIYSSKIAHLELLNNNICNTGIGERKMEESIPKKHRILHIYDLLRRGGILSKKDISQKLDVSEKSIQRDIEDLRVYLHEMKPYTEIIYDKKEKGYKLHTDEHIWLQKNEILAITKILLESRAFSWEEMDCLLEKLSLQTEAENRKHIQKVVANEKIHYQELQHPTALVEKIWDISMAVRYKKVMSLTYKREYIQEAKTRDIFPVGLLFSEYYFYLVAFLKDYDFDFPTLYRLDRIQSYEVKDEHFSNPHDERFEEGIYRKKIPFMQPGELLRVKFRFFGQSIEAVLDRFPHACILSRKEKEIELEVEVFGGGIKMWLLSQIPYVEVLAPESLRQEISDILSKSLSMHQTST